MIILLLLCAIVQTASSQLVSRNYKDKAMSKVLVDLRRASKQYKISFIHNELEDYTVTKSFTQLPIPEAIRECIGYYPITMKVEGDSLIFVEAMVKAEGKLIGRIVDSKNQPVIYANIALLNVGDTAIVNSGVSNENGDFVIPTTEERLRVRISCVGYETLVLNCETGNLGTIIRSCVGFGISDIAIISPAADIYDPKVIRATMRAFFGLHFSYFDSFEDYLKYADEREIYTFMLNGKEKLHEATKKEHYSLVFGNVATGLDPSFIKYHSIFIEQLNTIDSLNLDNAVSIAVYEFTKGRLK
jgi:tRNA(Leu) C34 or U34 (ribose-2'-O)-methylase TrmL